MPGPSSGPDVDPGEPVGAIVGVAWEGVDYAVVHHAEGWAMFEDACTHAGCSFVDDGGELVEATILQCACHGSEFDLRDGSVHVGPATRGLSVVPLHVDAGRLRPG
jgi:nitrite reductase/ring-hydroxylating ferredoxin subunit